MPAASAYLDHNATSPLRPEAFDAMVEALATGGNPSAVHASAARRAAWSTRRAARWRRGSVPCRRK